MGIQTKETILISAYNGNEAPRVKVYREGGKPHLVPRRINWVASPWKTWKKLAG